jgi:endoglucanase
MNRREFLKRTGTLAAAAATAGLLSRHTLADQLSANSATSAGSATAPAPLAEPTWSKLPRWRGFNLLEKFMLNDNHPFRETDFAWLAEWGFNFVRLPMDYRCWTDPADWTRLKEDQLAEIDTAVNLGHKHHIHVSLNFHRAPGYTVAKPAEKLSLWVHEEAQRVAALHWAAFARRYHGRPSSELSFDLVNEPGGIDGATYAKVAARLVEAIRHEDDRRLIIADGTGYGSHPVPELIPLHIAQSAHSYAPMAVTHQGASWVDLEKAPVATWPLKEKDGKIWDRARLAAEVIRPWHDLAARGVGVHVGEFGCFNKTPHAVALAWMTDILELFQAEGWGWALWNLRGGFGVLDSDRTDVTYEDFRGHKLDRAMLDLLRAH